MNNNNYSSYIRKKAILTAAQIIKKAPDTKDDFIEKIQVLITDSENSISLIIL